MQLGYKAKLTQGEPEPKLEKAIALIDAANSEDPSRVPVDG